MKTRSHGSSAPRGIALVLVMVVIFALTVIVAAFAYSMTVEMHLAQISDYDVELEWMGRSGMELARFSLANKCQDTKDIDALDQFWAGGSGACSNDNPQLAAYQHGDGYAFKDFPLGNGKISVKIIDMERKFNINAIAQANRTDLLQRALTECGVTDPTQASTIVDSILDWVSAGSDPRINGAKDEYYNRLNPPYNCKKGTIEDISELLLIRGITPEIYWGSSSTNHPPAAYQQQGFSHTPGGKSRFANEADNVPNPVGLVELFSPFGGRLNVNTASAKTLQLLPGLDPGTSQRIIEQRTGPDGVDGTQDDVPFHNVAELNSGLPGGGLPPGVPPGRGPGGAIPLQAAVPGGVAGAPPAGLAAGGLTAYCDVRSYAFEVHVDAEINGVKRTFIGVLSRGGGNASQIQCVRFHWVE